MATTTIPQPKEGTVAASPFISDSRLAELGVRPEWAVRKAARTVLAALGHPGYGEAFARRVLAKVEAGYGTHESVYGTR